MGQSFRIVAHSHAMKMLVVLALAAAVCSEPEAEADPLTYLTNYPSVYSAPSVASPLLKAIGNPAVTYKTAVSNGAVGPSYIAKNGPTVHVVKREAEADPALVYNTLPLTYNTLPATTYSTYNTLPVTTYNTVPVTTPYNAVAGVPYNTHHAVAYTPAGVTHSSNVGICHNSVGQVVPC